MEIFPSVQGSKVQGMDFLYFVFKQVNYTETMSTGMLLRHLWKCHRKEYDSVLKLGVEKKKKVQNLRQKILVLLSTSQVLKRHTCIGSSKPINLSLPARSQHFKPCAKV
jgi:hypothetical protein